MYLLAGISKRLSRAAVVLFSFCIAAPLFAASPVLDRIVERGELRVAMTGNQQPFSFRFGKKETLVGFDVDLAKEVARVMNVELEIVTLPFSDLIDALEAGQADMVISGMTITAARTRGVSFVGPYVLSGKSLLINKRAPGKLKTPGNFNQAGLKLAALSGSTSESLVKERLPEVSLTAVAEYDAGISMLLDGKTDGMVADLPILAYTKNRYPSEGLQLVMPPLTVEPMGIAIAMGDAQLENYLRNYLLIFEKTGFLQRLYKKWFEGSTGDLYR
ncbi:MAG: transporter substrate-binding domain-containing protein [Pseudomonadota bacterium]